MCDKLSINLSATAGGTFDASSLPLELILARPNTAPAGLRILHPHISAISHATTKLSSSRNELRESTPAATALCRAVRCRKKAGQNPQNPRSPIAERPRSNPSQGAGMYRASGAEVSPTERQSSRLNIRRSTSVGASIVMSVSEVRDKRTGHRDCHQPQLSAERSRLAVSVAFFSGVKRPGRGV